jgi:hypothetical protein
MTWNIDQSIRPGERGSRCQERWGRLLWSFGACGMELSRDTLA